MVFYCFRPSKAAISQRQFNVNYGTPSNGTGKGHSQLYFSAGGIQVNYKFREKAGRKSQSELKFYLGEDSR